MKRNHSLSTSMTDGAILSLNSGAANCAQDVPAQPPLTATATPTILPRLLRRKHRNWPETDAGSQRLLKFSPDGMFWPAQRAAQLSISGTCGKEE